MKERGGGGKLVTVSSITERFGAAKMPGYAAAKAALGGIVRSLAIELARYDIQVNNLQPGWIETDATQPMRDNEKLSETVVHRTPARRWGKTADFEGIAVYFASRASDFHTGDTVCIRGLLDLLRPARRRHPERPRLSKSNRKQARFLGRPGFAHDRSEIPLETTDGTRVRSRPDLTRAAPSPSSSLHGRLSGRLDMARRIATTGYYVVLPNLYYRWRERSSWTSRPARTGTRCSG